MRRVRSRIAGYTAAVSLKQGRVFEAKSACARGSSCALVTGGGYGSLKQPCTHALPPRAYSHTHTLLQPP